MSDVILCNISDANNIIEETRIEWVNEVFDTLNIPDEIFDVKDIQEYRMKMNDLGMDIIMYANGEVDIYRKVWYENATEAGWLPVKEEHLVAQWKTPERIMRVDTKGNMYYEIHIKAWSIKNISI